MKAPESFNAPAEMAARFGYLAKGVLGLMGVLLLIEASLSQNITGLLRGALCLAISMLIHALLVRSGRLESCRNGLDGIGSSEPPLPDGADSESFASLLEQRAQIEASRGTPAFSPWDLSDIRRQISAYLDAHPDFALRFRAYEREDQR